ncbi:enoyl-CoA hydratase [Bacillus salacetis]|uniref:Enoyl-CoA hydratase n=1 Tax=Bacillus salacetis TaxID=2315464 RepID=A0A3A1QVP5_9BACI|nr:MaoC family dehydratase [Bacillus salacetis]RIW32074.1 enoyl-CoA hydratase [Bacillus salacetis]
MLMKAGDVYSWQRTFTMEDVLEFGRISGDQGRHHVHPDEHGRLMVHGLLTASIGTKIGGDLNYIAREMVSRFIRPVFTGDTVTCEVTLTHVEPSDRLKKVKLETIYRNQRGEEVITGSSYGIIRD